MIMRQDVFIRVRRVYPMLLAFVGLLVAASAGAAPTSLASGTLDSGFGKGGRVITTFGMPASGADAVLVQPDGKIVAAGYPGNNRGFALVRYTRNGSLDPTFGSHGRVTTSFSPDRGGTTSLARQPDGKIVARRVQKLGRSNPIRRICSEIEWGVSTPMLSIEVGSYQQRFVTHLLPRPHVASAAKNWAAISRSRSPAATPRPRTR
jgi:uncharacterized delta-60 repeat protein